VDIDVSVLRSLEAEKDISMDLVIRAIEDALLVAYRRSMARRPRPGSRWTGTPAT